MGVTRFHQHTSYISFWNTVMIRLCLLLVLCPFAVFARPDANRNANSSSSSSCSSGWLPGPAGLGCVLLQTESLTWEAAAKSCWENYQAHLVEIKNKDQQEFLRTILHDVPFDSVYGWWIGATDLNREGSWYWTHSLEPMDYSDWDTKGSQPDDDLGDENCAMIWGFPNRDHFWNDFHCSYARSHAPYPEGSIFSICQRSL